MTEHVARVEQLRELVEHFEGVTTALRDAVNEADRSVSRLHDEWAGEAASAHRSAHDRWAADAARMNAALARLRALVDTAGSNYESAGATNLRMWS